MNYKRLLSKVFRFGMMKRLKRGVRLTIFPDYLCTHNCKYCSLRVKGVFPKNERLSLEAWKRFLNDYELASKDAGGIREVILTGGEPTILPYFKELLEWMLFEKKWYVTMFSNLSNKNLLTIRPSLKLRVGATYHHGQITIGKFHANYKAVNKVHRVDVEEIGYGELKYSKVKRFLSEEEIENLVACVRVAPDQSIHLTCRGACEKFCQYEK